MSSSERLNELIYDLEDATSELHVIRGKLDGLSVSIDDDEECGKLPYKLIDDQLKADFIVENWDKINLQDLEKIIK